MVEYQLPTELFLTAQPGSARAIEYVCDQAARSRRGNAIAVAVAAANVSQTSNLLFGTAVGIVSVLGSRDRADLVSAARRSVATGATEIAVPNIVLDEPGLLTQLKSFLGAVPVTVDITSYGDADLSLAEHALLDGADYVSYSPTAATTSPTSQTANLVALAGELHLGGVKVASASEHHATVLRSNEWAISSGNARHCMPVEAPLE